MLLSLSAGTQIVFSDKTARQIAGPLKDRSIYHSPALFFQNNLQQLFATLAFKDPNDVSVLKN